MAKFGRPRKELDQEMLTKLCQMFCSIENCAYFFNVSPNVIQDRCKDYFGMTFEEFAKHQRQVSLISAKTIMWQKALKGDNTCLINLLKVYDPDFKEKNVEAGTTNYIMSNVFVPEQIRRMAEAAMDEAQSLEDGEVKVEPLPDVVSIDE